MTKSNISFLIPTLNEETNLPYALESCSFADDVTVLDCGSLDATRQITEKFGARFLYHSWEGYARQKNWGLDNIPFGGEWIFILDADEMITRSLRDELLGIASGRAATENAGFYVNRFFVWEGREIRHCGYYPSWNLRFFRKGRARYEEREVHEHMVVNGPVGYLKGEMHHEDRRGRDFLWQKHLRYAQMEARELLKSASGRTEGGLRPSFFGNSLERKRAVKERIWPYLPARGLFRFFYMFVLRCGFLDGAAGLDMCLFMTRYEQAIARYYSEYRRQS